MRIRRGHAVLLALGGLGTLACGLPAEGVLSASVGANSTRDGSSPGDAATEARPGTDGRAADGAAAETGGPDVRSLDSAAPDASPGDTGAHDTGAADTGPADTGPGDSGKDAPVDGGCNLSACPTPPSSSWSVVAFESSRSAACPSGLTAEDVLENPSVGSACACGTSCTTDPVDCTNISVQTTAGDACGTTETSVTFAMNETCVGAGGGHLVGPSLGATATVVPATGCAAAAPTVNPGGVSAQADRVCAVAPAACAATACGPLPAGFSSCLFATGDQACPANVPTKHSVASSTQVTCGSCPCTADATCDGTLTFYANPSCGGANLPVATGACVGAPSNTPVGSVGWAPGAPVVACTVGTPQGAAVALESPDTVCCP